MVPPPWAPTGAGRATNTARPATRASARNTPNALRMALAPPADARLCTPACDATHEHHDDERQDRHHRRNDEAATRLRLLQPQIVPRCQGHPGPGLPRSAVPRLEPHRPEDAGPARDAPPALPDAPAL